MALPRHSGGYVERASICAGIVAYKRLICLCFQHETVEGYTRYFNQIVG